MRKQFWILMSLTVVFAAMNLAVAQSRSVLKFSAPFPFQVGEQSFQAGKYSLSFDGKSQFLELLDTKTSQKQFVPFVTRLSSREKSGIVFDSVNKTHYLSEVYMIGADGFQIRVTQEEHKHDTVDAPESTQ